MHAILLPSSTNFRVHGCGYVQNDHGLNDHGHGDHACHPGVFYHCFQDFPLFSILFLSGHGCISDHFSEHAHASIYDHACGHAYDHAYDHAYVRLRGYVSSFYVHAFLYYLLHRPLRIFVLLPHLPLQL